MIYYAEEMDEINLSTALEDALDIVHRFEEEFIVGELVGVDYNHADLFYTAEVKDGEDNLHIIPLGTTDTHENLIHELAGLVLDIK